MVEELGRNAWAEVGRAAWHLHGGMRSSAQNIKEKDGLKINERCVHLIAHFLCGNSLYLREFMYTRSTTWDELAVIGFRQVIILEAPSSKTITSI